MDEADAQTQPTTSVELSAGVGPQIPPVESKPEAETVSVGAGEPPAVQADVLADIAQDESSMLWLDNLRSAVVRFRERDHSDDWTFFWILAIGIPLTVLIILACIALGPSLSGGASCSPGQIVCP